MLTRPFAISAAEKKRGRRKKGREQMKITRKQLEPMIDASIGNKPAPTLEEIKGFVQTTSKYDFAVTLVEPYYVRTAAKILHPFGKKVCTVLSYPLGGMTHEVKLFQARKAIEDGTDELDNFHGFKPFSFWKV